MSIFKQVENALEHLGYPSPKAGELYECALEKLVTPLEELKQARAENEKLRAALKWYADESNYDKPGMYGHRPSDVQLDKGFRATEAMTILEKGNG